MSDLSPISFYFPTLSKQYSTKSRQRLYDQEKKKVKDLNGTERGGEGAPAAGCSGPAARRMPGSARPAPSAHLLVWDAGCSWLLWKGYLNSSLLPLLPELTRITLMGLVLSPILPWDPGGRGGGLRGSGAEPGVGVFRKTRRGLGQT